MTISVLEIKKAVELAKDINKRRAQKDIYMLEMLLSQQDRIEFSEQAAKYLTLDERIILKEAVAIIPNERDLYTELEASANKELMKINRNYRLENYKDKFARSQNSMKAWRFATDTFGLFSSIPQFFRDYIVTEDEQDKFSANPRRNYPAYFQMVASLGRQDVVDAYKTDYTKLLKNINKYRAKQWYKKLPLEEFIKIKKTGIVSDDQRLKTIDDVLSSDTKDCLRDMVYSKKITYAKLDKIEDQLDFTKWLN
jgi:hypothetical protein